MSVRKLEMVAPKVKSTLNIGFEKHFWFRMVSIKIKVCHRNHLLVEED